MPLGIVEYANSLVPRNQLVELHIIGIGIARDVRPSGRTALRGTRLRCLSRTPRNADAGDRRISLEAIHLNGRSGAPGTIRTSDPQIRRLTFCVDFIEESCKPPPFRGFVFVEGFSAAANRLGPQNAPNRRGLSS